MRNGLDAIVFMPCDIIVESGKGHWQCPAQAEGTALWSLHSSMPWKLLRFRISGPLSWNQRWGPAPVHSTGWLGGGETSRFQYQPSARVVIFPVMFVGVQLKFVFLAERQEGPFGTHTTHMSLMMTWPRAWHWLPDS